MKTALEILKERRSCRSYQPRQIAGAELDAVLEAGVYAPTGMGAQSPVIVAVQDPAVRDQLSRMNARIMGADSDPFYGAPTVLVVLADKDCPTRVYDGSCVMANLLNAAESVGLGACWVHRAKEEFESEEGRALLRAWGLDEALEGVGHCVLGYRAEPPAAPAPRKSGYVVRV